ncbi:hypothetical protein CCAX7_000510 [Capsulimonas corticalis]|uniref:Uncharacterized protein n=1 Tax=Capsulimonas corticalis TaxID=2219043 RepID=A0A402CRG6_9BACT|nr:hypothetical protein [Capsulimonas corticalis]BDI28000.1 hypothetical protein CCAX7_000510 [Capsulimonas corticalis]
MAHPKCGRPCKTKNGAPCENAAGQRTDHVGVGACWKHGGNGGRPVKHGLYSKIERPRLKELLDAADELGDPLDLLPHVKMLGALVTDWVERYDTFTEALIAWHQSYDNPERVSKPTQLLDITSAAGLIGQIGAMVDRIHKHQDKTAVPLVALDDYVTSIGLAVIQAARETIHDDALRAEFIAVADKRLADVRIDLPARKGA